MKLVCALTVLALVGCGKSSEDKESSDAGSGKVTFETTAGTLYLEDNKYELSCNQYMMKFWIDTKNAECEAVTIGIDFNDHMKMVWNVKSTDESVSIEATEQDGEKLKIGKKTYNCYMYRGPLMVKSGTDGMHGTHFVLSEKAVEKPSQLTKDDVYAVGFNDADNCDYLFK